MVPASGAQPMSVASALAAASAVGVLTSKNFSKWRIVRVQVADLNNSFLEADVLKTAEAVPSYCHFLIPGYFISQFSSHVPAEIRLFPLIHTLRVNYFLG